MTQTYNENVVINGTADETQLTVEGHSTQTNPLQQWQDSSQGVLAQVTDDGRLQIGDTFEDTAPTALIEVHRDDSPGTEPVGGLSTQVKLTGAVSNALEWVVNKLELLGTGGVSERVSALRVQLAHNNSGSSSGADLRAGDFEVMTQQDAGKAVSIHASVNNQSGAAVTDGIGIQIEVQDAGTLTNAYGLKIEDVGLGSACYALHTGTGLVHFGDYVGIGTDPSTKFHLYDDTNNELFAFIQNAYSGKGAYVSVEANSNYAGIFTKGIGNHWFSGMWGNTNYNIFEVGGSDVPFTIEPGANNHTFRIDSNGRIGIGTTDTLGFKMTIQGPSVGTLAGTLNLRPIGDAQGQRSSITFHTTFEGTADNGPRRTADIVAGFDSGAWGNEYLAFHVGNNGGGNDTGVVTSEKVRIDGNGNVGIGVTNPSEKLDVSGNAKMSGNLELDGDLDHDGSNVGFYGATPIAKPTVSGSTGGNVALQNLLTELANLGLLTDSTT